MQVDKNTTIILAEYSPNLNNNHANQCFTYKKSFWHYTNTDTNAFQTTFL